MPTHRLLVESGEYGLVVFPVGGGDPRLQQHEALGMDEGAVGGLELLYERLLTGLGLGLGLGLSCFTSACP